MPTYFEDHQIPYSRASAAHLLHTVYLPPLLPIATILLLTTVRCYSPSTTPPKLKQCRECFTHYSAQDLTTAHTHLLPSTPRAILCLGAQAISTLTKFSQGKPFSLRTAFTRQGIPSSLWGDYPLFTTFSPGAVLHSPNLIHPVTDHITLVHSALLGTLPVATAPNIVTPFSPTLHKESHV